MKDAIATTPSVAQGAAAVIEDAAVRCRRLANVEGDDYAWNVPLTAEVPKARADEAAR